MADDSANKAAQRMLDAFASVGATIFDVTRTGLTGEKVWFESNVGLPRLAQALPSMLNKAQAVQHNIIVRPHGPGRTFVQLDDLKIDQITRVAPAVFLTLETSPGNFQAWVAMVAAEDKDFVRRLRKGTGADPSASGATRVAGSLNFKPKYAPDFPRVMVSQVNPGKVAEPDELERLGLVAKPEAAAPERMVPARSRPTGSRRKWPSYTRCLEGAPLNHGETGPDVSKADFVWCMTAITWGWTVEKTKAQLIEESAKAKENGEPYANITARNAAAAVERRQQFKPARPDPR